MRVCGFNPIRFEGARQKVRDTFRSQSFPDKLEVIVGA
jgi:hypothetical protein